MRSEKCFLRMDLKMSQHSIPFSDVLTARPAGGFLWLLSVILSQPKSELSCQRCLGWHHEVVEISHLLGNFSPQQFLCPAGCGLRGMLEQGGCQRAL